MIRIAVGYVAVVVLCALLILLNPMDFMGREQRAAKLNAAPSTASQGALDQIAKAVSETLEPEVTAAETQTAAAPAQGGVAATTAAILADLTSAAVENVQQSTAAAQTSAVESEADLALRKMSSAVVEGLKGTAAAPADGTLEGLVAQALAMGETDAAIDAIVNEAVAAGAVEAPAMLRTTEGKVDTAVLLASILAEAQGDEFGQGDLSEPSEVIEGGTLAMQVATEDVLYVVQSGDSLGSLALRFYGDAGLFTAIFKANRQVLDTPESLAYGMKLLIPARSGL